MDTLGIDLGSVSIKMVVLSGDGLVRHESWRRTHGRPIEAARLAFHDLVAAMGGNAKVGGAVVTGSGKSLLAGGVGAGTVNEIVAHATAAWTLHPGVRGLVEIGGQDSKFVRVGRGPDGRPFVEDHAFNELCAAGTGAFLDQMAGRMGMDIASFAAAAAAASRPARVAGRCSVFAKTDMIHLQQRACPPDELAAGLCFALVRTYVASLCRGRPPEPPIVFQGGVAMNGGVARALVEILGLRDGDLVRPERPLVMGAIGAALVARAGPWPSPRALSDLAASLPDRALPDLPSGLVPLVARSPSCSSVAGPGRRTSDVGRLTFFLGLDVGSVTTKAVALDAGGVVAASCYLPTAGRPVDAVRAAMDAIRRDLPAGAVVARLVTTGSGRHLAADLLGADEVEDEITSQARSAARFAPDADTVFEIGGQDSKYIRLSGGRVTRFQMNRACAAGTGAFLEEQAGRLGIDVREGFAAAALASTSPVRLGSRCTVFMDSDLVHHLQHGASTADLCAGLAHSVASNYLDKVVGSRPVGRRVVFQGGVARNDAVHAAFEAILGHEVARHPHPETSGAWGAALRALELGVATPTRFSGLAGPAPEVSVRTFDCRACDNTCEVQEVTAGERRSFFGSVCGRFERGQDAPVAADDAFATRDRLLRESSASPGDRSRPAPRGTLGLPLALSLADHLPFWTAFLEGLGFAIEPSGPTDGDKVALGAVRVPAELCQPAKVFFGHAHDLVRRGVRRVFVPHLRMFRPPADATDRYACPYTQSAPFLLRAHLPPDAGVEVVTFEYPVPGEDAAWTREAAVALGVTKAEVRRARRLADEAQARFRDACRSEGRALLDRIAAEGKTGAVLIGRPYNTQDRRLNLNLARRLSALGLVPVPMDFLPLDGEPLPPFWNRVRWGYGREQLQAGRIVRRTPSLAAVVVTNFGCGPDAFVDQYLEDELSDTPHIVLEFDDHQAEAGLVTRLEAFGHAVRREHEGGAAAGRTERKRGTPPGHPTRPLRDYTYWVPAFSDHARAYTGALASAGCRSVLLPPTDDESWQLGLRHAYGRECHPYVSFLGDLLRASRRPDFVASEACYYGPSYFGPCLLPQYMVALKLVLDRVGLGEVSLVNIADPDTMASLGRGYAPRLGLGIYAIDRLFRWKVEVEPRAIEPGSLALAYAAALDLVEEGLATRRFWRALDAAVARMSAVALTPPDATPRPAIGVIGDAYTRVNPHANDRLLDRLRDLGFEVWAPCSLIDVSLIGAEQLHAELLRRGRPVAGRLAGLAIPGVAALRALVDRRFPPGLRNPRERQFPGVRRAVDRVASFRIDKLLSLNLARVEELHAAGAAGVVNAMCHNCMLGTVTAALLPAMQSDLPGLATTTLIYEGLRSTHNVNRLEAFAHRVRS